MWRIFGTLLIIIIVGLFSCRNVFRQGSENINATGTGDWLIPKEKVVDGGPGKDGIPAISHPKFLTINQVKFLKDDDLVIGIRRGGVIRAYPHPILNWHEIVNDWLGDLPLAITYCPLTGSAIAWKRVVQGQVTTFGVSGLLYNNNLIPYDRATDSNWSQMLMECVNGPLIRTFAEVYPVVETSWRTWRTFYPGTEVLSTETGYQRNYSVYPYGDYRTNNDFLLFPNLTNDDRRLPRKMRVLGIIVDKATRVYPLPRFSSEIQVINDQFQGHPIVIAGSRRWNFAVAYFRVDSEGNEIQFTAVQNEPPVIMQDQAGNRYDLLGKVVQGPNRGRQLQAVRSFISYWFAWGAFYPNAEIYSP